MGNGAELLVLIAGATGSVGSGSAGVLVVTVVILK